MRQVYEVLRLKWGQGLSERKIAQSLGISRPAVAEYVRRAQAAGLSWPLPATCDAGALERLLFPAAPARSPATHMVPDWAIVHHELKRKGVTLFLLWQEYKAATPDGLQYSWFCHTYRAWASKLDLVMRQTHRAGEKLFVDYAGQGIPVVNRHSGEVHEAVIFGPTGGNVRPAAISSNTFFDNILAAHCAVDDHSAEFPKTTSTGNFRDCSESTGLPPEDVYRTVRVRTFAPGGPPDVRSR